MNAVDHVKRRDVGAFDLSTTSLRDYDRIEIAEVHAVSIPSNIAEGSKRLADDNKHFLRYALGSLAECDTQLIIAESLGYGAYTKQLKATIMSLAMGIRAYGKSLTQP